MHLLSTLRPSQSQLTVLATIVAHQDHPAQAVTSISSSENLIAARNMLMKLNVITFSDTKAALTEKGIQLAKDNGIIDDSNQLTDEGNNLVASLKGKQPSDAQNNIDMGMGAEPMPMEGFSSLFKNILNS